jgi:hypothetical protein
MDFCLGFGFDPSSIKRSKQFVCSVAPQFNSILTVIIYTSPLAARKFWYHWGEMLRKVDSNGTLNIQRFLVSIPRRSFLFDIPT